MSYTATYDLTGSPSASITLTIDTTPDINGDYAVTGISGTWNGSAITGLLGTGALGGNDNLAVPPGAGGFDGLDGAGVSFSVADGNEVNIFASSTNFEYSDNFNNGSSTPTFTTDMPCFLRGTRILTEVGEVAVEDLAIGDRLVTRTGQAVPIKWIGTRRYLPDPIARRLWARIAPVRIRRDAIADNVPHRDLLVSPDHSLYLGGHLINARHLLNGTSIAQDTTIAEIVYYHVELDRHEVIVAEGALAETYKENANRAQFHNAATYEGPDAAADTDPAAGWYAPHAFGRSLALAHVRELLNARTAQPRAA